MKFSDGSESQEDKTQQQIISVLGEVQELIAGKIEQAKQKMKCDKMLTLRSQFGTSR